MTEDEAKAVDTMSDVTNRCRLVLIAPVADEPADLASVISEALGGGDVASVILPQRDMDERRFQDFCAVAVPVIQAAGAAALIAGDSRVAGRVKADGLFVQGDADELREAMENHSPAMIVGGGNAEDRHDALLIGEVQADFIFFGRLDGDFKPEPHPKNMEMGEWWASMIDIPCIVMGGADASHVIEMAADGVEFVAFSRAVFEAPGTPSDIVAAINRDLDEKAPRFDA